MKINKKVFSEKNRSLFIIFITSFIPRIVINSSIMTFTGAHDDLGMLAVASKIAGYDWSALISRTSYYGFGFSALFFSPILKLFSANPYLMFQIMCGTIALFQSFAGIIAYILCEKYFFVKGESKKILISIIMAYSFFCDSSRLENDSILPVFTWLLMLLIVKLIETTKNQEKKKNCFYTLATMIILSYIMLLHTRAIIYWISFVFIVFIYFVFKRKLIVSIPVFLICGIVGFIGMEIFIKIIQTDVWGGTNLVNSNKALTNQIGKNLNSFGSKYFLASIMVFLGELFAMIQYSYGIFLVSVVCLVHAIYKKIKKKNDINEMLFFSFLFSFVSFLGMLLSSTIYWNEAAQGAIFKDVYSSSIFYLRYIYSFGCPLVLFSLIYLPEQKSKFEIRKLVISSFILFMIIWKIVISTICPLGESANYDPWSTFAPKILKDFSYCLKQIDFVFVGGWVFIVLLLLGISLSSTKKKVGYSIFLFLFAILTVYNYAYKTNTSSKVWGNNNYEAVYLFDSKVINEIQEISDDINYFSNVASQYYTLQMRNPGLRIKDYSEYKGEKNAILLSAYDYSDSEFRYNIELNSREYLCFNDYYFYREVVERIR